MEKINEIQIVGNENGILSVTLEDVLRCVKDGEKLSWSILWLEATGELGNQSMLDFEEKIKQTENGLSIEWSKLLELSTKFYQVIEIILIGDYDTNKLKHYSSDEEMYSNCNYVFELLDSSFWLIHSKSDDLLSCMSSNLPGVKETEPNNELG